MTTKLLMIVVLALIVLLIGRSLWTRDKDAGSSVNLDDLLLGDDGKVSKSACILLGAFTLHSWIMVQLTLTGKMTEGYMTIYAGAWIVPSVAKLITNAVVTVKSAPS